MRVPVDGKADLARSYWTGPGVVGRLARVSAGRPAPNCRPPARPPGGRLAPRRLSGWDAPASRTADSGEDAVLDECGSS
jgi:hypothetical protein